MTYIILTIFEKMSKFSATFDMDRLTFKTRTDWLAYLGQFGSGSRLSVDWASCVGLKHLLTAFPIITEILKKSRQQFFPRGEEKKFTKAEHAFFVQPGSFLKTVRTVLFIFAQWLFLVKDLNKFGKLLQRTMSLVTQGALFARNLKSFFCLFCSRLSSLPAFDAIGEEPEDGYLVGLFCIRKKFFYC
jgi:hypothetical protein